MSTEDPRGTGVPPVAGARCGTGVSPVRSADMGGTPMPLVPPSSDLVVRQGAYLPHWTRMGATYAVTFRLADSLPQSVLETWIAERTAIVARAAQQGRPLTVAEEQRLRELHSEHVEAYLDAGHGACRLRDPSIAKLVVEALRHFDGERYRLHAWCLMPNHVHLICEPILPHALPEILQSWKSFTAKAANRLLKLAGAFWQAEYYDHLIRDEADYAHAVQYLRENPAKACLGVWPWVWVREEQP